MRRVLAVAVAVAMTGGSFALAEKPPSRPAAHEHPPALGDALVSRPVAHVRATDLASGAALASAERRIARDRVARLTATSHHTVAYALGDDAIAINDVDGDGADDVMTLRQGDRPGLSMFSGTDGQRLWRVGQATFVAAYVAMPHGPGRVITVTGAGVDTETPAAGVTDFTLTVHAFDARTGKEMWATPLQGYFEYDVVNATLVDFPEFGGILEREGAAPLVLLDRASAQYGFVESASTIQPFTLSADDGSTVSTGPAVVNDAFGWVAPAGDLDGDGTEDVATATWGDVVEVSASSGASGSPLWSTTPSAGDFGTTFISSSDDIDGDGKPDLLVGFIGNDNHVDALSGNSGSAIWSRTADFASPLGDIDGDRRSDTRVVGFNFGEEQFSLVTATGVTRWARTVKTRDGVIALSWGVGDVDGDGIGDIYVRLLTHRQYDRDQAGAASVTVSGRTGRATLHDDLGWPAFASLDARRGDDFLRAERTKAGMQLTAFSGATGRQLWASDLRHHGARHLTDWTLATGRQGDRLALMIRGSSDQLLDLVDARTGRPCWSTRFGPPASGGVVVVS